MIPQRIEATSLPTNNASRLYWLSAYPIPIPTVFIIDILGEHGRSEYPQCQIFKVFVYGSVYKTSSLELNRRVDGEVILT